MYWAHLETLTLAEIETRVCHVYVQGGLNLSGYDRRIEALHNLRTVLLGDQACDCGSCQREAYLEAYLALPAGPE
jgi:hypothetical protein